MAAIKWLAQNISSETRAGANLRRVYRRLFSKNERLWTEVLHGLAASKPDVHFIQVGSNDSGYADPIRFHILNDGWKGIMIEPLPHVYERLCLRCEGMPGLILENVAIDTQPGIRPFYHLRKSDEPDLPVWYDMLGSFLKENVLKHEVSLSDIPDRITETPVNCMTFDMVCDRHDIKHFDILHIDAEGYDFEILRQAKVDRYQPKIILYENRHLEDSDYDESLEMLHNFGMLTHSDSMDTIAISKNALAEYKPLRRAWRFIRKKMNKDEMSLHSGRRKKFTGSEAVK